MCMEENNTFSLRKKGQTDLIIAFEVARSEVLTTVVLKNHVFCLACNTMLLSECNNILKEQIVFIFTYETVLVSHSFLLQNFSMDCHLDIHCVCVLS